MTIITAHDIADNFGRHANSYDDNSPIQRAIAKHLLSCLPFDFRPKRILEIGCGTGHLTALLKDVFPDSIIDATDLSPQMLAIAQDKLAAESAITFHICNGEDLNQSPHEKYDLIISNMTVQWFRNIAHSYQIWQTRLNDNGIIATSRPNINAFDEWSKTLDSFGQKSSLIPFQETGYEHADFHIKYRYKSTLDFLKSIKHSGATKTSSQTRLSPLQLKQACAACDKNHSATFTWDAKIDLAING